MARFVALIAALACSAAATVIDITSDNFDELTKEGEWMIEFYAPWCIHCKRLAPIWEQASDQLAGQVNFAKVDATTFRSLGSRFGVNGFPTIFHINANDGKREVRKAALQQTLEGIKMYAAGGFKTQPPMNTMSGPFGPTALAKYNALYYGDKLIGIQEPLAQMTGLPTIVIQFGMMMIGLLVLTGGIIGLAVYLGPKQHDD